MLASFGDGIGIGVCDDVPSFDARSITNWTLLLSADQGVTLDGSNNVQQWNDVSGSGLSANAVQATAGSRPAFTVSDALLGGRPSIGTAAGSKFLASAAFGASLTGGVYTLYTVFYTTTNTNWLIFSTSIGATAAPELARTPDATNSPYVQTTGGTQFFENSPLALSTGCILVAVVNGASSSIYSNKASAPSATGTLAAQSIDRYGVLARNDGTLNANVRGAVGEAGFCTSALSAAQISRLVRGLSARYGIAVS